MTQPEKSSKNRVTKNVTRPPGEEQRIQQQLQQKQQNNRPINKRAFDAIQPWLKKWLRYVFEKNALLVLLQEDILQLVAKKMNIKLPNQTYCTPPLRS